MRACVLALMFAGCATTTASHVVEAKHSRRPTDFHRQFEDAFERAKEDWVNLGWCMVREVTECERGSIVTASDLYEGNSWYFDSNGAATGYENFGCLGWKKHGKIFSCRRGLLNSEDLCVRALSELTRVSAQVEIGKTKLDFSVGVTPFVQGALIGTLNVQADASVPVTLTLESDARVLALEEPVGRRTKERSVMREVVTIERGTPIELPAELFDGISDGLMLRTVSRYEYAPKAEK
ncbi:MAG: hypothetical protein JNM17_14595 [Archangium sp.]|nr:hypothetical protein [Archangium sp.]